MPTLTAYKTWTSAILSSADMNAQVSGNIEYAMKRPYFVTTLDAGADVSITATSFTDVTGVTGTLTTQMTNALVAIWFHGNFISSTALRLYLDVTIGGTAQGGDDGIVGLYYNNAILPGNPMSFYRVVTIATPAAYTITLQAKVNTGTVTFYTGAGTANGDLHPQFGAIEIGATS